MLLRKDFIQSDWHANWSRVLGERLRDEIQLQLVYIDVDMFTTISARRGVKNNVPRMPRSRLVP